MRIARFGLLVFVVMALVGPLIRLLTWPSSRVGGVLSEGVGTFIYELVLLLWPTQPLAVMEVTIGQVAAIGLAIGANVALFALLGLATVAALRRDLLKVMYIAVCVVVVICAVWWAGFSVSEVHWFAVVSALALYAVPFALVKHHYNRA
jgi:hypothetical protein